LNAAHAHTATRAYEIHIDRACADAKAVRLETIDAIWKQRVERDGGAVGRDLEAQHRSHAEERRSRRPRLRTARDRVCMRLFAGLARMAAE